MLVALKRRPAYRSLESWAIGILMDAGAIRECVDHSHIQDRGDPHARECALEAAAEDYYPGATPEQAVAMVRLVLSFIGDTCPECK